MSNESVYAERVEISGTIFYSDGSEATEVLGRAIVTEDHPDLYSNTADLVQKMADEMGEFGEYPV